MMHAMLKTLLVAGALALTFAGTPSSARADHNPYWRSYWGWYDNTYQPYYNTYYGPSYYGYSSPNYYGGYVAPNYGGYYSGPYYGGYYNPGPSVGVRIGAGGNRVRFGWW